MEGLLGIFQSKTINSNLSIFLKALAEHQCFQQASSGRIEFVSHLTELLSKVTTRPEGLVLLDSVLNQCSLDIIEQKGSIWASFCIKACGQASAASTVPLACRSLGLLIEKSTDIPELSKAFSGNLLGNFIDTLKNTSPSNYQSVLDCIEIALRSYGGSCGPHRSAIDRFIAKFIDFKDENVVQSAARCLHLLQQVRGGSTFGITFKEAWQKLQLNLLGSLHETFDYIYAEVSEPCDDTSSNEKLTIAALELSDDPVVRASQLYLRFRNLIDHLIVALTEPFSVAKPVMPRKILNLIQRGLAINCAILSKTPSSNNLAVGALLSEIHVKLFELLNALILSMKALLAPFENTILGCVLESLKWTHTGKSIGFTKPYSFVRTSMYETLTLWCDTMKSSSGCELIADHVIEQIKNDIMPFENEVTLKVLSGGKKHMSKKARRLLHKAQNEKSNIAEMHSKAFNPQNTKIIYSDAGNQSLCTAALKCLRSVISSTLLFLKPVTIKDLLDQIFSIAIHVVANNSSTKTELYSNDICRENLYDVIYITVSRPHRLCPPPIQLVVEILNKAQVIDRSALVRNRCVEHLQGIEKILHPQKESIYYPIDKEEIRNALKNRREQFFERQTKQSEEEIDEHDSEKEIVDDNEHDSDKDFDESETQQVDLTLDEESLQVNNSSELDRIETDIMSTPHSDEFNEEVAKLDIEFKSLSPPRALKPIELSRRDTNIDSPREEFASKAESNIPMKKRRHTFVDPDFLAEPSSAESSQGEESSPKRTKNDQTTTETDETTLSKIQDELSYKQIIDDFVNELNEN